MARRKVAQREAVRRRDRKALLVAGSLVFLLLMLAGSYRMLLGPAPAPAIGGPFSLRDADGVPRTDSSFRGRYMLIFFGYTQCKDVCPHALTEMSEALNRVDPLASRIQPLFITVDPARDTPAALRRYVAAFSPYLIGLTGTNVQLTEVWRDFHVIVQPVSLTNGEEDLDHSAALYLMDPAGRFLAPIAATASRSVMQATLQRYVHLPVPG